MRTEDKVLDYRGKPPVETVNDLPSLTIQSDADDADISKIVERFAQIGVIDNLASADAMFLDVSELGSFADVQQQFKVAEREFLKLPSKEREIYGHDVAVWLDKAHEPEEVADAKTREVVVEADTTAGVGDDSLGDGKGDGGGGHGE